MCVCRGGPKSNDESATTIRTEWPENYILIHRALLKTMLSSQSLVLSNSPWLFVICLLKICSATATTFCWQNKLLSFAYASMSVVASEGPDLS